MCRSRKPVGLSGSRGFESLPLRHDVRRLKRVRVERRSTRSRHLPREACTRPSTSRLSSLLRPGSGVRIPPPPHDRRAPCRVPFSRCNNGLRMGIPLHRFALPSPLKGGRAWRGIVLPSRGRARPNIVLPSGGTGERSEPGGSASPRAREWEPAESWVFGQVSPCIASLCRPPEVSSVRRPVQSSQTPPASSGQQDVDHAVVVRSVERGTSVTRSSSLHGDERDRTSSSLHESESDHFVIGSLPPASWGSGSQTVGSRARRQDSWGDGRTQ